MNFAVLTWILANSSKKNTVPHWSLPWVSENSCRNALSKSPSGWHLPAIFSYQEKSQGYPEDPFN